MFPRAQIKEYAKYQFRGYYGTMVGVYIVVAVIAGVSAFTAVGVYLIIPPITVGLAFFSFLVYKGWRPEFGALFSIGFSDYGRVLGGMLWMWLFTFLWALLFIIPGIIKSIAYSMTPYLLAEYKNIPATQAIRVSMKITYGRKWDIFVMYLSFIGWGLLAAITCGLTDILYSGPYKSIAYAGMYDVLRNEALASGRITQADLGFYPGSPLNQPGTTYQQGAQYQQGPQYQQGAQYQPGAPYQS